MSFERAFGIGDICDMQIPHRTYKRVLPGKAGGGQVGSLEPLMALDTDVYAAELPPPIGSLRNLLEETFSSLLPPFLWIYLPYCLALNHLELRY